MIKVFNIFNRPKAKKCAAGEHIYKWRYLDQDGKEQTDQKNVKEEINSYLPIVDYKAQIKRGELDENGTISGLPKDYTGLPDNSVDYYKYLTALATMDKGQIADLMEQLNQKNQSSVQTEQTGDNPTNQTGQTPGTIVQEQSTSSDTPTEIIGGQK